jgi:hypothetical protein
VEKRRKDNATLKSLQADVQTLWTYMMKTEQGWDLLNSNIMGKCPEPKIRTVLRIPE